MNWPNLISLLRLLSVPLIIWLVLTHAMGAAFTVFFLASLSDFLDGQLARLLKKHTQIGAYLDPLADKCLLVALTLTLAYKGFLPLWFVILVVFRDLLIMTGALLNALFELRMAIQPLFISKLNTFMHMLLLTVLLACSAFHITDDGFLHYLIYLCALSTVLSGAAYVRLWLHHMNQWSDPS